MTTTRIRPPRSNIRAFTDRTKRERPEEIDHSTLLKDIIMNDIANPITRALAATLYLTGSRITEIVGGMGVYHNKKTGAVIKHPIHGLRPKNIEQFCDPVTGDTLWMFNKLQVLKRKREVPERNVYVAPQDNDVMQIVLDYARDKPVEERLFKFTRQHAWMLMINAFGKEKKGRLREPLWNHFFRHAHATHRMKEQDFDVLTLVNEMKWKSMDQAQKYVKVADAEIRAKLMTNFKNKARAK
jgi:site-specific recombinase XerD